MVRKYPTYKDSGIAWIGAIPERWNIVKTGRLFRNTKEIVGENSVKVERLALTLNGVIKRDKNDAEGLQPEQFDGYQYLRKNQLVFKLIDLENVNTSRVGICPFEEGMVSPAYIILKNNAKNNKFYYYFFLSLWYNEIFNHLGGDGVRSALNAKDLLNIPTVDISANEQKAIADYLDEKCGAIDKTIETEEKVIEKLKEYKQSLITETVTKGLDKSAPMKDSGIPWIGAIPERWNIVKTGRLFRNTKEIVGENSVKVERLALTLNGVIKRDKNDAEGLQPEQFDGYQYLRKNQLVFKLIDLENVNTSRVGICPFEEGMVSPAYIILKNNAKNNKFYYYFFLSLWYNEIFNHLGGDGVRSALNAKDLLNIPTVDISANEQQTIADYLDNKCAQIDKAIKDKEQVIGKLTEYKKSLIYECVTGKRMVA